MTIRTPREVATLVIAANALTGIYDPSNPEDLLGLLMHAARIAVENSRE